MRRLDRKGNGDCPSDPRHVGDEEKTVRDMEVERKGGVGPREAKSLEDGPRRSRAASSVIQKNRVDEGEKARKTETDEVQRRRKKILRRRRKGAGVVECGRGLYARRSRVCQ